MTLNFSQYAWDLSLLASEPEYAPFNFFNDKLYNTNYKGTILRWGNPQPQSANLHHNGFTLAMPQDWLMANKV